MVCVRVCVFEFQQLLTQTTKIKVFGGYRPKLEEEKIGIEKFIESETLANDLFRFVRSNVYCYCCSFESNQSSKGIRNGQLFQSAPKLN